jgi:hypothetical protein
MRRPWFMLYALSASGDSALCYPSFIPKPAKSRARYDRKAAERTTFSGGTIMSLDRLVRI